MLVYLLTVSAASLTSSAVDVDLNTLKFVHAVWRHGDRSPESHWPTDTGNSEASWPQGWGELTQTGMRQQYALGRYLRDRYDGFVSPEYDKYQIYIRSTCYNRTIMSAQANLAGMFPPSGPQRWNSSLSWQPIPVHTVEKKDDPVGSWADMGGSSIIKPPSLDRFLADCPIYDAEMERVRQFPQPQKIDAENRPFYKLLSDKSGVDVEYLDRMWNIWDPIRCIEAHANDSSSGTHRMPTWVNQTIVDRVKALYDLTFKYRMATDVMKQIRAGPILREMVERMERRQTLNDTEFRLRYYAYSAHDTSVSAVLYALADPAYTFIAPPYFSVALLELHQRPNKQWIVRLFFRNVTAAEADSRAAPYEVPIAGCRTPCTLAEFRAATEHLYPADWYQVCGTKTWVDTHGHAIILCLLVMGVLLLTMLTVSVVLLAKRSRQQRLVYQAVRTTSNDPLFNDDDDAA